MPLFHIFILAVVQGLTEFLPVSSSGHLLLTHHILEGAQASLCWESNRTFDVAVHVGTLASVLVYFHKDLLHIMAGLKNPKSAGFKLMAMIVLASLPVIAVGLIVQAYEPSLLCMIEIAAWTMLIFGIVLWIADRSKAERTLDNLGAKDAILIGLAQTLSLVPGTSRSGITMTAARFRGFKRTEAARFSLLLSIIASAGAGALGGLDLIQSGNAELGSDALLAALMAFLAGLGAITFMMRWLSKASFTVFAVYRVILGIGLLALIYSGALA